MALRCKRPTTKPCKKSPALQDKIQDWLPDARPLSVADVLAHDARAARAKPHPTKPPGCNWPRRAVDALREARAREGARLTEMLQGHITQLLSLAEQAVPLVPQLVEQQRQRFLERWKDAMALADGSHLPEAAQDRALTEATAFAIRIDVAEELTRLRSHLDEIISPADQRRRHRQTPGLFDSGTAPRSQHLGLQIGRAGNDPHLCGHEGADRANARTSPEHRIKKLSMDYPGNLFVVAAPSGAGKSSLVKALMELDSRVQPTVSHTTRPPRGQEKHGREYFFASAARIRCHGARRCLRRVGACARPALRHLQKDDRRPHGPRVRM